MTHRRSLALMLMLMLMLSLMLAPCLTPAAGAAELDHSRPRGYDAAALYNAGNAYARAGKSGLAVLNYERARLLTPNDPDLEANLNYVRGTAHLPLEPRGQFEGLVVGVGSLTAVCLGSGGVLIVGLALLAGRLTARYRWPRRIGIGAGSALLAFSVCHALLLWPDVHAAVVLTPETVARVSPVPMGDSLFTLPEAETVRIAAERDEFVLVETRAGRTGWVARADVAPVVPAAERAL